MSETRIVLDKTIAEDCVFKIEEECNSIQIIDRINN
jgi:hypothetical protein